MRFPGERAERLRQTVVAGDALSAADVESMWRLRARIFQLKPHPPLEEQYARFGQRVRMGQRNILLWSARSELLGMFSVHWRWSPDGRQLWFLPEYGFVDPSVRGSSRIASVVLSELVRAFALARGRALWFAGIAYPRSFQSLSRMFGRTWTLADPQSPPDARAVLTYLHETFAGDAWDRERHRVWLPTIPEPPPPEDRPRSEHWRRYERICPDWSQGYGLGMAARIHAGTFLRLAADGLTRGWRGLRR
ncbi:MAG TPA: hypothetical protein VIG99_15760 [Myxococcaceae bacterium]|jgi:hypothetical protein